MQYTVEAIQKRKNRIEGRRKVFSIILYIIMIPLIIFNISLIANSVLKPNETHKVFGFKTYIIISGSMQPNYNIGDIVLIKECDKVKIGDVIAFNTGGMTVTHRVVDIKYKGLTKEYITKGDYNNTEDMEPVQFSDIEGVCFGRIPYVGNIIFLLKNPYAIILIILYCFLLFIFDMKASEKAKIRYEKRKSYEKKILN